jgi:hypothetical protein
VSRLTLIPSANGYAKRLNFCRQRETTNPSQPRRLRSLMDRRCPLLEVERTKSGRKPVSPFDRLC